MHSEENIELINKAKHGDIRAFENLIMLYEKDIYNVAYRMIGNVEDSKDVAQEVCIKIFKNLKSYNFKCKFYTWVYRITVNTCIDELRKNKGVVKNQLSVTDEDGVEHELEDKNECTPEDKYIEKEQKTDIENKINMLDPDQKAVIILRYLKDLEYEEIAESLDCNVGTVKSRLNRAKKKLLEIFNSGEQNEKETRLTSMKGGDLYGSKE